MGGLPLTIGMGRIGWHFCFSAGESAILIKFKSAIRNYLFKRLFPTKFKQFENQLFLHIEYWLV